jgi:C4-dicarboxylate-specific signal transduction histidine kinase
MWLLTRGKVTKEQENGLPLIISGTISDISYLKEVEFELARINANLERRVKQELNKHKKQQDLLVQKSKLESLGEMAAGIAHEINQPLGIILLSVENLNEAYHMGKAEKIFIENKLNTITKSIDKIRGITDHMRVFSRDQKLEFSETFSVNDVIRDTMSLMQTQYKNQQIDLRIELEENLPPVKGKKVHLEQVLQNLISNARYAVNKRAESDPSGQYRKTIRISTKTDNKMVCIHVRDNGTGISAKHMKQIFDPFFTTKQQDLGTGLGLSICYGLIREMKGKIQFESKPGEFTLAIACLPVAMAGKNSSKTA